MNRLTFDDLLRWKAEGRSFHLIDVREKDEHYHFNIGGELMPLSEFNQRAGRIDLSRPIVFYCEHGIRSQIVMQRLQMRFPEAELYDLEGGVAGLERE
ncbi:MAG: rhodanese-like domain-containing protein [Saprospiraceae bacterium]|nr:rhodanese-like domain-containing protein [Saprospiraceae bacterium]MCB0622909.1 rhodanese-like domain-containing protein [Saprospiraceae bacterium]MCB0679245.1 rhodanese-like domain-containing protein [Saprospiraceae bacterium]MCB0679840.1 rhodanese-like domain-containing protein [Saprospiraceae bacterium]